MPTPAVKESLRMNQANTPEDARIPRSRTRRLVFAAAGVLVMVLGFWSWRLIQTFSTGAGERMGVEYLQSSPVLQQWMGNDPFSVQQTRFWWHLTSNPDGARAAGTYRISGHGRTKPVDAYVWLTRTGNTWSVDGARVVPQDGAPFSIGRPPGY